MGVDVSEAHEMNTDQLLGTLAEQVKRLQVRAAQPASLGSITALALSCYAAGRKRGRVEGWQGAAERIARVLDEATALLPEPDPTAADEVVDAYWHDSRRQLWQLVEHARARLVADGASEDAEARQLSLDVDARLRALEPKPALRRRLGAWLLQLGSQLATRTGTAS